MVLKINIGCRCGMFGLAGTGRGGLRVRCQVLRWRWSGTLLELWKCEDSALRRTTFVAGTKLPERQIRISQSLGK